MKLTFQIHLQEEPAQVDGCVVREKLVIAGWHGEMKWHLALKLLAYVLFIDRRPAIETGVGWRFKPDLVAFNERGQVDLWIDCGNIAVRKIDRVATKVGTNGQFFIVKRRVSEARNLLRLVRGRIKHSRRLCLMAFDESFVDSLTEHLEATNELRVRRLKPESGDEKIDLELKNRHGKLGLSSSVYRFLL